MVAAARVLIVDDEPSTAEMFRLMLEQAGFETFVVHGTGTAINAIRRHRPDLLLVDVMMPGVSGLELCRYVRREPDLTHIPIVMISAKSQPEDEAAGLAAGATIYLKKPVSKQDLLRGIERGMQTYAPPSTS